MTIHHEDLDLGALIRNFKEKIQETTCYSLANPNIDERRPFVPMKRVEAYFSENQNERLNNILNALYHPEIPPTYPEAILRRYNSVFCILLEIGKGDIIHLFTEHDALRDNHLPFDESNAPLQFPERAGKPSFYQEFCQHQWKYSIPSFRRPMDQSFPPQQILPIIARDQLSEGKSGYSLSRIIIHEDYNFLHTEKSELQNTFTMKSYASSSAHEIDLYDIEVRVFRYFRHTQGILGYCGTYNQDDTFNIILEYADQGDLDEYFKNVPQPTTGGEIIKFWQRVFIIIKALAAIHKLQPSEFPNIGCHLDIKPSNILVASHDAPTPYEWKLQLADLGLKQIGGKVSNNEISNGLSPEIAANIQMPSQHNDIWSLGCIFSEAATWIASGYNGLLAYRLQRTIENDEDHNPVPRTGFHDGRKVLDVVQEHHRNLSNILLSDDFITQSVIDLMVEEMLEVPEGRPTADQLLVKSERILSKARYQYAALGNVPSQQNKSTIPYTRPVLPRSPLSNYEISRPMDGQTPSNQIIIAHHSKSSTRRVSQNLKGDQTGELADISEQQHFPSIVQPSSNGLADSVNTDAGTTRVMAPSSLPLTPRLLIPDFDDFSSSAEQEHDSIFRRRTDSPRRSRSDGRQVSEAPLSVADVQQWKKERKSKYGATPLFDSQSLKQLSSRDHIFVIDDSASMSLHWNKLRDTVEALAYVLKRADSDGIDVALTTSKDEIKAVRSTTKLIRFLEQQNPKQHPWNAKTDINSSLGPILMRHRDTVREGTRSRSGKRPRPFTLYVFTDGIWKGDESRDTHLGILEKDLNCLEFDDSSCGVQFITFGDDPVGSKRLDRLDNELHGDNFDVTPCTGNIRKMLFGVGSNQRSEQKSRSKKRLPAVKSGIRRFSTTLSLKSGPAESRGEIAYVTNPVAAIQPKPRHQSSSYGLLEWTTPPSPAVDVLFVHGLDGDREKDWVVRERNDSSQRNWPKDLMSPHFQNARLLTYGYDSTPWHSSYPIKDVITSQARTLLNSLQKVRERTPDRPLIIVAQGVGGLLAKSALLQSHLSLDTDTTKQKAIKLSTTGLILLEPPDVRISGELVVPAVLETHGEGHNANEPRKSTAKDAVWLKLQMESFQTISDSFNIIHFHSCRIPHQPHRPFLPTTNSKDMHMQGLHRISVTAHQLIEEPKTMSGNMESTNAYRISKAFEVDRINEFRGQDDRNYQAIIHAFEDLHNKAIAQSRFQWSTYEIDRASAESNGVGFSSSDVLKLHPARNDHFTGRHTALDSIRAALFHVDSRKESRGAPSTVEIYGSAGVGKTQLALEFIHRYKHKFSTILWVDSQNRASIEKTFCKIERKLSRNRIANANAAMTQASRLNISSSSGSTSSTDTWRSSNLTRHVEQQGLPSCSTDLVKAWLARENNSQWVMVFDGADDGKKSWIQEFFPNTKNGNILITSRHRGLLKGISSIRLDPMSEEDAIKLLLYSCPAADQNTALELVRRLDCVPLAIAQAGSYISSTKLTPSDYLSRFKEARPRAWDDYATRMRMVFSTSVDEVFLKGYQEVKAKDHKALDLLIMCSLLAAENIPGLVLEALSKQSGLRLEDMVDTLFNNGFGHREENLQSFRMHTLVQSWLRKRLTPEMQQSLVSRVLSSLAAVVEFWRMRDEKTLQGLEKLLVRHTLACLSRVENVQHCNVSWCVLGEVCKQDKRYGEATILFEKALSDPDIRVKKSCADRQRLGFELGSLYQMQGRSNDAVAKYEEILGECDQSPLDEDSIHLRGQLLLDIYRSLSSVYTRIGRTEQASKVLMEGVAKLTGLFGRNSFQTLQLLDICAAEHYDQEDYAQAEYLSEWIVSAQTQTLGIDHPGTIHAQEKLARVYFQRSKLKEAEELSRHCLTGLEKSLGPQHPATLQQVVFLGRILSKSHKFPEAEELLNRAVEGACEVLGLQHPETLNAREELAMCYEAQRKWEEAHAVYLQVMFGREDAKDPGIRRTLERLLSLMEIMEMKEEARQLRVQWSNGFDGAV